MTTLEILKTTKSAWRDLNRADTNTKNIILNAMADALVENTAEIIAQNNVDMENAKGTISDVMLDRLMLYPLWQTASGILQNYPILQVKLLRSQHVPTV